MKRLLIFLALVFCVPVVAFAGSQQLSGATAQAIIDEVSDSYLASDPFWDDSGDLLVYLNNGLIQIATESFCLQSTEKLTLVAGTTQYAISSTYFDVETVIYNSASGVTNKALKRVTLQSIGDSGAGLSDSSDKEPVYWVDWGGSIVLEPAIETGIAGDVCTVYLYTYPSGVTISQAIPIPAIYETALVYYMVSEAYKKAPARPALSEYFEAKYIAEMNRKRALFNKRGKEPEVVIK